MREHHAAGGPIFRHRGRHGIGRWYRMCWATLVFNTTWLSRAASVVDRGERSWQRQCKGGASADNAAYVQFTAHPACQIPADGQAQPGAADRAREVAMCLHEWIENGIEPIGRDADSRVGHAQVKEVRGFPSACTLVDCDSAAGVRELDRVTQ